MNEKRIYVVVAKTVQHPLRCQQVPSKTRWIVVPGEETRTIIQPPGRVAAQVAHVVSKMRVKVAKQFADSAITTIILSVPDSYQLAFREFLLVRKFRPEHLHIFNDQNDAYGPGSVMTAICTEPVPPTEVEGILDYLPLWDGKP